MNTFLLAVAIAVVANSLLSSYRLIKGPTLQDRLIGVNIINTQALVVLLLLFFTAERPNLYLDIAVLYALLNLVLTATLSRYLETGRRSLE